MSTKRHIERQKRALVRRRQDVIGWMADSVCSETAERREFANRKLFIAQLDVRRLEAKGIT